MKNVIEENLKLKELEEGTWYFIEAGRDFSNDFTGIKVEDGKVYVSYVGGDFEEPYTFWFELSKEALDDVWNKDFGYDYDEEVNMELDLNWVEDVATVFYNMIMTGRYSDYFGETYEEIF